MIFLTYLIALALSGVAEYYSIIGLAAIFPGAFWPVVIMGATLGAAKLITVSWLYRNWKVAPIGMKVYLSSATVILMLITSMGIFGYLSKAHLEHSADTAPLASKVQLLDEKIRVTKENLDANRKVIKQMDEMVDQTMGRSNDEKGIANSVVIRRNQQKERSRIQTENETYQKTISQLTEEKFPLQNELQKAESDFGPIKYVAELIYGSSDIDIIDKAVRLIIMLIMVVFDPLAVLLLIAANMSMTQPKRIVQTTKEPEPVGVIAQEVKHILSDAVTSAEPAEQYTVDYNNLNSMMIKAIQELNGKVNYPVDKYAYLKQPFKHFENLQPMVAPKIESDPEPVKNTVEVKKDNVFVLDHITGETMPPITTKYDYDANFAFVEKENK
jgi:hypothetical protein